jgi:hypothetical protein
MKIKLVLLMVIFISITKGQEASVKIYFLKDPNLSIQRASKLDIKELNLETVPWLTNDDIQFYDYSTHCIYLKADASKFIKPPLKPFVVIANTKRGYIGEFFSFHTISSHVPELPYIVTNYDYPKDVIRISEPIKFMVNWDSTDVRNDDSLKAALISLKLFHAGLNLELKSVNIVDNSDTATVEYTYIISNNEKENLLVIDPDKMDSRIFHYFTDGVCFWVYDFHYYIKYVSEYKKVMKPLVDCDTSWFSEIQPNTKIERTVRIKGYPKIKSGKYRCDFKLSSPHVERESRNLSRGRIWLGSIKSNDIQITVK